MLKDKNREGVASSEIKSTFNFSNAIGNIKNRDLTLVTYNLSEKSETQIKIRETGLSEAIQKREKLLVKKDIIKDDESLKKLLDTISSKILDFNVIVNQKEKERVKILVEKIRSKWNNKNKKFINIHEIIFNPHTLIYAYGVVVKSTSVITRKDDGINLDEINQQKIIKLSNDLFRGVWKVSIARRILIPKKKKDETRSLNILPLYDKIIATAIQIILNIVFEKHSRLNLLPKNRYFTKDNHGYRFNKGCHTALNVILTWGLSK